MNHVFRRSSSMHARCLFKGVKKVHPSENSRHFCELSENHEASSWKSMEGLVRCPANYIPLSPISFLQRAAKVYSDRTSVVYGSLKFTWEQTLVSANGWSSYLHVKHAPRDPSMISVLLQHSEAKIIFVDYQFLHIAQAAFDLLSENKLKPPALVLISEYTPPSPSDPVSNTHDYESLLASGDSKYITKQPNTEFDPISINYTSGTTSRPKGVVYNHRGAYLNALATASLHGMINTPVYLWTVPMFHCNGWCLIWGLAALGGTNICLRHVSPKEIFDNISLNQVTHMGGAPTVLNMIVNSKDQKPLPHKVEIMTGGAPPPPPDPFENRGVGIQCFSLVWAHETCGPGTSCVWKPEWDSLPREERLRFKARQGVEHYCLEEVDVRNSATMESVPADGVTMEETPLWRILKRRKCHRRSFCGGWFRSGDLAVKHDDGYIEVKDRLKDIVISGGENISTVEVETVLYRHPAVLEAAVVARPDNHWGQTPCAFVKLKDGFEMKKARISRKNRALIIFTEQGTTLNPVWRSFERNRAAINKGLLIKFVCLLDRSKLLVCDGFRGGHVPTLVTTRANKD
ncbi:hypothetical protein DH2020_041331 [Rehmannia glutinosa]|uniref:4-coumarate--CoA ligase n=1 Tax=Rehmannia glutinosa TaxID=99300 RepID=A0ABR0USJ8_REHGL